MLMHYRRAQVLMYSDAHHLAHAPPQAEMRALEEEERKGLVSHVEGSPQYDTPSKTNFGPGVLSYLSLFEKEGSSAPASVQAKLAAERKAAGGAAGIDDAVASPATLSIQRSPPPRSPPAQF